MTPLEEAIYNTHVVRSSMIMARVKLGDPTVTPKLRMDVLLDLIGPPLDPLSNDEVA